MPIRAERPHVGTDPVSVRYIHLSIHQDRINIRAGQGRKKSHAVGRPNWHGYRTDTGSVPTCGLSAELALGGRRVCDIGMSGSSSDVVSIIFCFQVLSFLDVFRVNTIKNKADYTSEEVGSRDFCRYSLAERHIEKFYVNIHLQKDIYKSFMSIFT